MKISPQLLISDNAMWRVWLGSVSKEKIILILSRKSFKYRKKSEMNITCFFF